MATRLTANRLFEANIVLCRLGLELTFGKTGFLLRMFRTISVQLTYLPTKPWRSFVLSLNGSSAASEQHTDTSCQTLIGRGFIRLNALSSCTTWWMLSVDSSQLLGTKWLMLIITMTEVHFYLMRWETGARLRIGKISGIRNISAELLKTQGEPMTCTLNALLTAIWLSGIIFPDLNRRFVILIWKGIGDCLTATPTMFILLSVTEKMLAHQLCMWILFQLLKLQKSRFMPH